MFEYKETTSTKECRTLLTNYIAFVWKRKLIRSDKSDETIKNLVDEMVEEIQKNNDQSMESAANIAKLEGISTGIWIGGAIVLGGFVVGQLIIGKAISKN